MLIYTIFVESLKTISHKYCFDICSLCWTSMNKNCCVAFFGVYSIIGCLKASRICTILSCLDYRLLSIRRAVNIMEGTPQILLVNGTILDCGGRPIFLGKEALVYSHDDESNYEAPYFALCCIASRALVAFHLTFSTRLVSMNLLSRALNRHCG